MQFITVQDPSGGEAIDNLKSSLWVERYQKAGEFEFQASLGSGIRDRLPSGTLVSHVDTREVMVVENHEIKEDASGTPVVIVTGRSMETYLEQRNPAYDDFNYSTTVASRGIPEDNPYISPGGSYGQKAYWVARDSYDPASNANGNQALLRMPNDNLILTLDAPVDLADNDYPSEEVSLTNVNSYALVQKFLGEGQLGIRTSRPGLWPDRSFGSMVFEWIIHEGDDISSSVAFNHDLGEIVNANYLFSDKTKKTVAFLVSNWVVTNYIPAELNPKGPDVRMITIDCKDIDESYETQPTAGQMATIEADMKKRAAKVIGSLNDTVISNVELAENLTRHKYRTDYHLGDIVGVSGNYDASTKMRVTEYVEIEDITGEKNYPTLSAIEEN